MSYKEGIVLAITELKDRNGSSMISVKKHMQGNLPKDKKWMNATFLKVLKSGVASGDFVQIKNSYKLSPEFKKKSTKKTVIKTPAPKKKTTAPKKKTTAKAVSVFESQWWPTREYLVLHIILSFLDHQKGKVCSQEEGYRH